jgi:hypothetical protein
MFLTLVTSAVLIYYGGVILCLRALLLCEHAGEVLLVAERAVLYTVQPSGSDCYCNRIGSEANMVPVRDCRITYPINSPLPTGSGPRVR